MTVLAVHDTGEGPALLMLHAFPLDASMWDAQVAALSGRYRMLRPDFWGCGASPAHAPWSRRHQSANRLLPARHVLALSLPVNLGAPGRRGQSDCCRSTS